MHGVDSAKAAKAKLANKEVLATDITTIDTKEYIRTKTKPDDMSAARFLPERMYM